MQGIDHTYNNIESAYEDTVQEFLKLNENNLDTRLNAHAGIYAYFSAVSAYAKKILDKELLTLEVISSKHKEEKRDAESKKVAAHEMADYISSQPEVIEQKKVIIEAEYKYNLVKGIVFALSGQRDMLIQLSSNRRQEQKLITNN